MLVYSKANQSSIDRAVAKARKIRPLVKIAGFGQFDVRGSKGEFYRVTFAKSNGELVIDCGCRGNQDHNPCYHSASVAPLYKGQVQARFEASLCTTCHKIPAAGGVCEDCQTGQRDLTLFGGE